MINVQLSISVNMDGPGECSPSKCINEALRQLTSPSCDFAYGAVPKDITVWTFDCFGRLVTIKSMWSD